MNRLEQVNNLLISPKIYDYIILGGGISGLQSAEILTSSTKNILIVEAQQALGGRIQSLSVTDIPASKRIDWVLERQEEFNKVKIQKGATWIQERHVVLRELCQRFKIPMKIQFSEGTSTYLAQRTYTPKQLLQHPVYGPQIYKFLEQIDKLAEEYRVTVLDSTEIDEKYKQMLGKYDSMTLQEYLRQNIKSQQVRDFIQNFLQHTECISADVNSMHEVLAKHGRSNDIGILKEFLGTEEHEASYLIEGSQQIVLRFIQSIQKNIKSHIDQITKLNSQVIDVDNILEDLVVVTCLQKGGKPFKALTKKVICAVPLQVVRNINFTNISQNKRIVFDNQLRTNALKSFIVFKKPFWRSQNMTGDGLFSYSWLANMCHDISPEDQSCGILVFFHNGKKYYQWKNQYGLQTSYEDKLKYMKKMVAQFCNIKQGSQQYIENFNDCFIGESGFMENQFIRSGFQSNTRPGTFTQILRRGGDMNALYGDEKNIYFVGSEFSDSFASYIEGAIRISRKKAYKLIGKQDPLRHLIQKVNVVTKH